MLSNKLAYWMDLEAKILPMPVEAFSFSDPTWGNCVTVICRWVILLAKYLRYRFPVGEKPFLLRRQ